MPYPRTEHEADILSDFQQGEAINVIARRYDVSRRTVHAVIDRNEISRRTNRHREQLARVLARAELFNQQVLRYVNRQDSSPGKSTLIHQLAEWDTYIDTEKERMTDD